MKLETLERGMAHLSPEDFRRFSERVSQAVMESLWPPITKMELFLTRGCNLRCKYCWDQIKPQQPMGWKVAKKAVDRLIEWSGSQRNLSITLFGGEPLLEVASSKMTAAASAPWSTYRPGARPIAPIRRNAQRRGCSSRWRATSPPSPARPHLPFPN